jgi:hypothetical protein
MAIQDLNTEHTAAGRLNILPRVLNQEEDGKNKKNKTASSSALGSKSPSYLYSLLSTYSPLIPTAAQAALPHTQTVSLTIISS